MMMMGQINQDLKGQIKQREQDKQVRNDIKMKEGNDNVDYLADDVQLWQDKKLQKKKQQ
jgi:hypothetical protein